MTNKWFRRFMSVFLALVVALNPKMLPNVAL